MKKKLIHFVFYDISRADYDEIIQWCRNQDIQFIQQYYGNFVSKGELQVAFTNPEGALLFKLKWG